MRKSEFLTPNDASRLLGVSPATVRQMARSGALHVAAMTESGNRLFARKTVEALAAKRATLKGKAARRAL